MSTSLLKKSLRIFEEDSNTALSGTRKKTLKIKKSKTAIEHKSSKTKEKSKLEENLKKIQLLNTYKVSKQITEKIFKHAHKDYIPLEKKSKKEERTAFTEEDFAAFERDYMPED